MAATKKSKKVSIEETKPEDGRKKSAGLIYLGVVVLVLGILSATPIVARTFLSAPADFMVVVGIIAIVVGLITKGRN